MYNHECECNQTWDGYGTGCGRYQTYNKIYKIKNEEEVGYTDIYFRPFV